MQNCGNYPAPKKTKVTSDDQLHPISFTPLLARVFESFLAEWIVCDNTSAHFVSKQFGNLNVFSTVHYLVDMLKFVLEGLDKPGHFAYLATTDFTKAFDRVNHSIVISKLIKLGVQRSIIPTICSFLTKQTNWTKLRHYLL